MRPSIRPRQLRRTSAARGRSPRFRALLLLLLSTIALTGCVFTGIVQGPIGVIVAGLAVLALAACTSSGGGGGGEEAEQPIDWPAEIDLGDLTSEYGFIIEGDEEVNDDFGWAAASGGDVNGDGIEDLVVSDPDYDGYANNAGQVYVIFGDEDIGENLFGNGQPTLIQDLSASETVWFYGYDSYGTAGYSLAVLGNVNDDGGDLADILIGAPDVGAENTPVGGAWVIFGDTDLGNSFLTYEGIYQGDTGLRLAKNSDYSGNDPTFIGTRLGISVSGGDIDGDGISDILVGGPGQDYFNFSGDYYVHPRATVIFGDTAFNVDGDGILDINSEVLGSSMSGDGVSAGGGAPYTPGALYTSDSDFGQGVAAADLDGDGRDDLIASATGGLSTSGSPYGGAAVVFGKGSGTFPNDPNNLSGNQGFLFVVEDANTDVYGVTALGDINGDGYEDFAVGSSFTNPVRYSQVHVIFGHARPGTDIDLSTGDTLNGSNGFRILFDANTYNPRIGGDVDLNRDGYADMIVGAEYSGGTDRAAHVIFGGPEIGDSGEIDLTSTSFDGTDGFTVRTAEEGYLSYHAFAFGDVNGDGFDDAIMGVQGDYSFYNGAVYVVFGLTESLDSF